MEIENNEIQVEVQKEETEEKDKSIFIKEIELNEEKYLIEQKLPQYEDLWFEINENEELIKYETLKKEGDVEQSLFSKVPVFIKSICKNIETGEERFELVYYQPKIKKWDTMIVDKTTIYQKSRITSLANSGIPITSINSNVWIRYFYKLEEMNYENIPIIKNTNRLGWYNNNTCFVPYTNEFVLDTDENLQKWANAYVSKGTLEEWINSIKDYRKNNLFRFILSSAFSGSLLRPLNQRIFIIYNYGNSRYGKSAAMFSAMSAWGNPEELRTSFFGTSVGIERVARFQNDLALWIDEKQVNKSQSSLEQLIYMLGNGTGKLRGNKTGGVQHLNTWKLVGLATGEETLSTSTSTTGISTRCLEIEGSPFGEKEEVAEKVYDIFSKCYGTAGKEFIKILLEKYSKNDYEVLKQKYEEVKTKLKEKSTNDINSYISNVSVVTLADIIISKEFFEEETEELSYRMAFEILDKLPKQKDIDIVEECYEQVYSWLLSNHRYFDIYTHYARMVKDKFSHEDIQPQSYSNSKTFGLYETGVYYVLRGVLQNFLTKNGFSYHQMVREFAKRNYIISKRDYNGNVITPTIQKKFRDTNARVFAFPVQLMDFSEEEWISNTELDNVRKVLQEREQKW